jgi:hypothetical protein
MNDVLVYMYGVITGMAIIGTLLLANHILIKLITASFAGSEPKTVDAIKVRLNKSKKPY